MKLLSQGAEAKIYNTGHIIIKDRIRKSYRIPEIDGRLRSSRTKREAKILRELEKKGFRSPKLLKEGKTVLEIEFLKGRKVRDILSRKNFRGCAKDLGKKVAFLHNQGIIHGDLTTSNMILKKEAYLIDFGLSFYSQRIEDKAVDIHLFRQALESKHHEIWEDCFTVFAKEYAKHAKQGKEIMERFREVEKRGRNKQKS